MNKNLVTIGIFVILICVSFCGCETKKDEEELSIYTVIEAVAQVVNSTDQPVEGVSVTFEFGVNGNVQKSLVRSTDSSGWTAFAVESVDIPELGYGNCDVYLKEDYGIKEEHAVSYNDIKYKTVDDTYYWSISARLVQL